MSDEIAGYVCALLFIFMALFSVFCVVDQVKRSGDIYRKDELINQLCSIQRYDFCEIIPKKTAYKIKNDFLKARGNDKPDE